MPDHTDPLDALVALTATDFAGLDAAGTVTAGHRFRAVRGWLDHAETLLTARAEGLYTSGGGAAVEDAIPRSQGVSAAEARRRRQRSTTTKEAPGFGDALATGAVTAEHVDLLGNTTARLDAQVKERLLAGEQDLLASATSKTPDEFRRDLSRAVTRAMRDEGIQRTQRQRHETRLSRRVDQDGMHHLHGIFDPETGAALFAVIDRNIPTIADRPEHAGTDRSQLAAHALVDLAVGGHQQCRPVEAEISVLIDIDTLTDGLHDHSTCEYDNSVPIPPATVRRLICNATIVPIILDTNGVPLNVGRSQRLATRAQRKALRAMYQSCALGCDTPFNRCEMHHLHPYQHGGLTDLENLLPVCGFHHHAIHERGWTLHLDRDRTLTVRRPDGTVDAVHQLPTTHDNEPDTDEPTTTAPNTNRSTRSSGPVARGRDGGDERRARTLRDGGADAGTVRRYGRPTLAG